MTAPLIAGNKITLSGREFVLPSLSTRQVRDASLSGLLTKADAFLSGGWPPAPESVDAIIALTHLGLSRNYPELTVEQVGDLLGLAEIGPVYLALLGRPEPSKGELRAVP